MKPFLLLCACLLFYISSSAQIMGRQQVDQFPRSASGTLTNALTWLPQTYSNDINRRYPLIIFLHGSGETGTTVADLAKLYNATPRSLPGRIADGWDPVAVNPRTGVQDSFIVVSPQSASWSYSYSELKHILPAVLAKYRIDTSRIYLTGLSAGGGGVYSTFGSRDSNFIKRFAAMATVNSAGVNASNGYTALQVEAGIRFGTSYGCRMWTIAGEGDYLLTVNVRYHDSTNLPTIPPRPNKLTVLANTGHNAWGRAYDPAFRPVINYYGNSGTCNNGCAFGGVPVAPAANGSTVRGSGVTQDSLNLYEWLLLSQRTFAASPNPTAYAGPDVSIASPLSFVTLQGTGTAGEGFTISSFQWSKISGPTAFSIESPSASTTVVNNLVPGTYIFRLTVRNSNGVTATDDVQVSVTGTAYASPQITSVTADQTIVLPTNSTTASVQYTLTGAALKSIEWKKLKTPGQPAKRLGILGSSTSQGAGSSVADSSYTGRLRRHLETYGLTNGIVNLSMSGYSIFKAMPTSYVPTGSQPAPDPALNITAMLNQNVDVVIVNYPSNGYDQFTASEIMMAFQTIYDSCTARGVDCYITTTQPRNDFGPAFRQILQTLRDSILNRFGDKAINFYDPIATPGSTTTKAEYAAPDNIHINDGGHRQLFNKVVQSNVFKRFSVSPATINNAGTANAAFTNLTTGEHVFMVSVTDTHEQTVNRFTRVTVSGTAVSNNTPTANAGADQTITLPVNTVTLNGSGADTDGTITAYQWTKIAGPAQFSITTPAQAQTNFSNLVQGVYQVELQVTDDKGGIGRDTVVITVNAAAPSNNTPTANAGADQTITLPVNTVTLSGSGTDTDGTIASYQWTKIAGPAQFSIATPAQAQTSFSNLVQGVYQVELRVTDDKGAIGRDTVVITVNASQPTQGCSGKSYMPAPAGDRGYYNYINLLPGDTLFLDGTKSWSYVYLQGKNGTPQCPIVIMNKNGQARLTGNNAQLKLFDCTNIKVIGTGTPGVNYGIYVQPYADNILINGAFAVVVSGRSKNIEISNVHVSNAGIGMSIKEDGGCDPQYNYPNWVIDSISLHHNKIVKTWNQGMYIGNTSPDNGPNSYDVRPVNCNGTTIYPRPFRMGNIKVYENDFDSTGRAAIQLSSASTGRSEIYNNRIRNSGIGGDEAQGAGINLGAYSHVWVYNNHIVNTLTFGVSSFGASSTNNILKIENNIIDSSGYLRHYYLWQPGLSQIDLNTRTVYANTIPWVYSIGLYTKPTENPVDSTRFRVSGNSLGYRKNVNGGIVLSDNQNTFHKSGNFVCNNFATTGGSTNVVIENPQAPVFYSTNCNNIGNTAPFANAGANQTITLPVNSVTLTGNGSDPDGTIAAYQWTKIAGPAQFSIATPAQAQTGFSNLVQGVYQVELRVTDDKGAIGRDTVIITVNAAPPPPNNAPTANAGANQTITLPTNAVTLNGSGTDTDGTIAAYQWTKIAGPTQFSIASPAQAQTSFSNLVQGVYQVELRVTDDKGAIGRDTVIITVNAAPPPPPNNAPTANAGTDQTITLPTNAVTLNGSGTDTDGTIAVYQWTKIAGPTQFSIATPAQAQTSFSNLVQGVYQVELRVTDDKGAIGRDTVIITVNAAPPPPPNNAPTANAGANQTITLPTNAVTLNGSGTDTDGTIAAYQWTKIAGPAQFSIATPAQAQTSFSNLVQGVYQVELRVTDDKGAIGRDTVIITVNAAPPPPPNNAPTANAGTDQTITLPTNAVTLNGSGTDTDGTIAAYQWTKIAGPTQFSIATPAQAQTSFSNLVQGVYQVELRVTDDKGAIGKDTVIITVNAAPPPPPNNAPTANAGANQTITLPTNAVTLNGSGTDTDGTITAYQWTKIAGPAQFSIATPAQAQTGFSNLVQGVYQIELRVTDDKGAIGRDTVIITVNAAPPPPNNAPTANAGANQTITLPVNSVTLVGSGTDTDGTIAAYQWTKIAGPGQFTITSPTQSETFFSDLVQGTYQMELRVTDDKGATGRDTVVITVNAGTSATNNPPVANAGTNQTITLPANAVMLTGSGTDSDGTITAYQWTKISGPAQFTIATPTQSQTSFSNLEEGVYQVELRVTDNKGASGRDTITIVVEHSTSLKLYPNPTAKDIVIEFNNKSTTEKIMLQIIDINGKVVDQKEYDQIQTNIPPIRLDVSKLNSGVYFVRIKIDANTLQPLKFIKY